MQRTFLYGLATCTILSLMATTPRQADAALKHRYGFTADVSDSVGTADGELIDAGTTPRGTFADGMLDLTANVGESSNAIVEDAYVNLPNGTISALGDAATFEIWTTVDTNRTWSEIFSFGRSNDGEDISTGGAGSKYATLIPQAGANQLEVHITEVGVGGGNPIRPGGPLSTGVEHHIVTVIDRADTMGGANPDGTAYLYLDGGEVARAALYPGFALSALDDLNNWLGRSQWPDPLFDGSYNELRLYDHALNANDVALNGAAGTEVLAEVPAEGIMSLEVNTVSGAVSLTNHTTVPLNLIDYSITSAGGALSTSGWNSLDDQEMDNPGEGWDESGGSDANELIELVLGAAGETIAAGAELTLGNAFNPSVFGSGNDGDLAFQFGLAGGALLSGGISYVTTSPELTGDYDDSDLVSQGDLDLVLLNWGDTVPPTPTGWINQIPTDGLVSQNELDGVLLNWGDSAGTGAVAAGAVPEPASLALLILALSLVAGCLWRH